MQPLQARVALRDEAVAAQRVGQRIILAAVERPRIEGIDGGDDQFFRDASDGVSSVKAKVASWTRSPSGSA